MSVTRRRGALVGGQRGDRSAVDARVAEHDVVVRLGEPQRLGKGEGEDAVVARERERRVDDLAHAHRLARDADRHAAGADDHVERVVAQRGEVQRRDRARHAGDGIASSPASRRPDPPTGRTRSRQPASRSIVIASRSSASGHDMALQPTSSHAATA